MTSWKNIASDSDFSIHNLPYGMASYKGSKPFAVAAIGDEVIHIPMAAALGLFDDLNIPDAVWQKTVLNGFIALGKTTTDAFRLRLQSELCDDASVLKRHPGVFIKQSEVVMHLPVFVGDYTDFYSSIEHATNVGKMFRDPENALLPNWRHLPVGYHGRASSIVVSGTPIVRPAGQTKPADGPPVYTKSKRMDFELEMAFIVGKESRLGSQVFTDDAEDYIFGMVLFNDWSARDIQKWEYVPLGPFLGKNFGSSVSPWVVPMEALHPFRVAGPEQEPEVLPYLKYKGNKNYDIHLEVDLITPEGIATTISRSNYKYMYWNMAQQLAHHTVNGCNVRVGDMMASGTISGPTPDSFGSMLELSWSGKNPIHLNDGSTRTFIEDGDSIVMRAWAEKDGKRVGFGSVSGRIEG